ncbi:MAG: hypothetical protein JWR76_1476 [Mucilaginibacter sp.]|nr:hypothetical protein [Mucilaginibacter sp.]
MKLQELNLNEMMCIEGGTVSKPSYTKITKIIFTRNNTAIGNSGFVFQNSGDITIYL